MKLNGASTGIKVEIRVVRLSVELAVVLDSPIQRTRKKKGWDLGTRGNYKVLTLEVLIKEPGGK